MRIAFFGSGSPLSAAALRGVAQRHDVQVVIEAARPLGRRDRLKRAFGLLTPTPLGTAARELGVERMEYAADRVRQTLAQRKIELTVVASFPVILPAALLTHPGINLHTSLLPRHRGADPLFWTYHADDRQTGTTVHWLDAGIDGGDVISQRSLPLPRGYPMPRLYDDLARSGSVQLAEAIAAIESGSAARVPQNASEATHEPSPSKRSWRVEFDSWPAERTWHFLSGIGSTYGALCRDPSGADMPAGRTASYSAEAHGRRPGTWERRGDGSIVLYCPDGTVTSMP